MIVWKNVKPKYAPSYRSQRVCPPLPPSWWDLPHNESQCQEQQYSTEMGRSLQPWTQLPAFLHAQGTDLPYVLVGKLPGNVAWGMRRTGYCGYPCVNSHIRFLIQCNVETFPIFIKLTCILKLISEHWTAAAVNITTANKIDFSNNGIDTNFVQETSVISIYLCNVAYPVSPSMVSSIGRTWILEPYFTSGQAEMLTTSPNLTRRLFLTTCGVNCDVNKV